MHGPGDVHDKDVLPGRGRLFFDPFRRLHDHEKEILVLPRIKQETCIDFVSGQGVAQHEIPVAPSFVVFQGHLGNLGTGVVYLDVMAGAGQFGQGHAPRTSAFRPKV